MVSIYFSHELIWTLKSVTFGKQKQESSQSAVLYDFFFPSVSEKIDRVFFSFLCICDKSHHLFWDKITFLDFCPTEKT